MIVGTCKSVYKTYLNTVNDYQKVIKRFTLIDMTANDEVISIYQGTDQRLSLNTFGSWFITLRILTLKTLKQLISNWKKLPTDLVETYICIFDEANLEKTYERTVSFCSKENIKNIKKIGDIIAFFLLGGLDSHTEIIQKIHVRRKKIEKKMTEIQWNKGYLIKLIEQYSDSDMHNHNYNHLRCTDLLVLLSKIIQET